MHSAWVCRCLGRGETVSLAFPAYLNLKRCTTQELTEAESGQVVGDARGPAFVATRPTSTTPFSEERMKATNEAVFRIKIDAPCIFEEAVI